MNFKKYFDKLLHEYGMQNKKLNLITDGPNTIKTFEKLTNLKRFNCVAHSINRLIQHDSMASKETTLMPLVNLIPKLRTIQKKLIFEGEELRRIHYDDKQKKLQLSDFEELDDARNADEQIQAFGYSERDSNSAFEDLATSSVR